MSIVTDLTAAVEAFEFTRAAPGQMSLFREPKPRTAKGQLLLADSGVSDQPVNRPKPESAMPPEVTAPKQVAPLAGQKSMFGAELESPKHSWQMTYNEVRDAVSPSTRAELQAARPHLAALYPEQLTGDRATMDQWGIHRAVNRGDEFPRTPTVELSKRHKAVIAQAAQRGEKIPPHVIAEYENFDPMTHTELPSWWPQEGGDGLEPVHHAVGKRFGIPPEAVRDAMSTHPDVLAKRDKYFPPSSSRDEAVGPTLDYEKLPISSARIDYSRHTTGDTANAPIDYLREFDPHSLKLSEHEDGMSNSGSVRSYAEWAKAGHVPPPVSVFDSSNGNGDLISTNRRRVLAARMAGKKLIGWHGRNNDETGLPLKYGDILKAAKEFHGQQFSREPGPVEFSAIPAPVAPVAPQQPSPPVDPVSHAVSDYKQNGHRSAAFKSWFGDWENEPHNASKVVHPETREPQETGQIDGTGSMVHRKGKPIAVYHGTGNGGWDRFDKRYLGKATASGNADHLLYGPGFYFTEDHTVAADYAKNGSKDHYVTNASRQDLVALSQRVRAAHEKELELWKKAGMENDAGHIRAANEHLKGIESLASVPKASFEDNQDVLRAIKQNALSAESPTDPDQPIEKLGHEIIQRKGTGEVKKVHLNIRNPFDIDGKTHVGDIAGLKGRFGEKLGGKIASAYGYTMNGDYGNWAVDNSIVHNAASELFGGKTGANDHLEKLGYDGITHIGGDRMGGGHHHRVWIAFHPNQIKHVENRGTFDPNDERMEFARQPIGPVEFSTWREEDHNRETTEHDGKEPGEFAPKDGGNGHEIQQEDAARTERAVANAATKPPESFAPVNSTLPKPYLFHDQPLSEITGDIPSRPSWMRKRDSKPAGEWTEAHDFADAATAKYDIQGRQHGRGYLVPGIDEVVNLMPVAHAHIMDELITREAAKKAARLHTGVNARHEYADSDWSSIPRFDETSREIAAMHPEIGIRPDDHYAPQKMWDFVREGKYTLPKLHSQDVADVAAAMIASARKAAFERPIVFAPEPSEDDPEDEWTVVHHGDADDSDADLVHSGFDPSQFSRTSEIDAIADRMGVDADSLRAALSAMLGSEEDSLIWLRKLARDPSRGVIRDRDGRVIGFLTRNGKQIQVRDASGKMSGTVTHSDGKATFRDRRGHMGGSVGEFSRVESSPFDFSHDNPGYYGEIRDTKVGPASMSYRAAPDGTIEVSSIRVPQRLRGQGHASTAMSAFTAALDEHGKPARLLASPLDAKTHLGKLVKFYQGHGFTVGKPGNPAGHPYMHREAAPVGPVEFARIKPAKGQMSLFDEPQEAVAVVPATPEASTPKSKPVKPKLTDSGVVDWPQTNTYGPIQGVRVSHGDDGFTRFYHPTDDHSLTKIPTPHAGRFLDEINGRLSHPANSGHSTLDRVLSGQGKFIGKGHEGMAFDAGNGMVVKAAVVTPFHINHGIRTPEDANAIVSDSVDTTKKLRAAGVPGILPQYGAFHDGRSFAIQKKVDTEAPLQEHHFTQLEGTIHGLHNAGYALRDMVQAGLDHNGNAAIYDIGSAAKLSPKDADYEKRSDFNNLQYLAKKHGVNYVTPDDKDSLNKYEEMLWKFDDHPGMTPKEARAAIARLNNYSGIVKRADPDMHEFYADAHRDLMTKLQGWKAQEFARKPSEGQQSFNWDEAEHPRDSDGKFSAKLHHTIKQYLLDGTRRYLRDIHGHTGHTKVDALDPTANETTAALKHLRDSGQINSSEPAYGEPQFYMTDDQLKKHKEVETPQKEAIPNVADVKEAKKMGAGRTRSAVHFDPAITGPSGASLTSYEWHFEWIMDDEKSDDPIRVSDWNEADFNEHTKRNVVHSFSVSDADGEHHRVSLETAVKMLGLVKKSEDLNKVRSLANAAIKLAQAKQEHQELLEMPAAKVTSRHQYDVKASAERIADLEQKVEFLNHEAAMMSSGKTPVDHYRDVARKLHAIRNLFHSDKTGKWAGQRIAEFVKAAGGHHEDQRLKREDGYRHYKSVAKSNGMNVLGEHSSATTTPDAIPERKVFGKTVKEVPAWTDQKMRNWFSKNGADAEPAIEKSLAWLKVHHPDYDTLLNHPDFSILKGNKPGESEFSRDDEMVRIFRGIGPNQPEGTPGAWWTEHPQYATRGARGGTSNVLTATVPRSFLNQHASDVSIEEFPNYFLHKPPAVYRPITPEEHAAIVGNTSPAKTGRPGGAMAPMESDYHAVVHRAFGKPPVSQPVGPVELSRFSTVQ